LEYFSAVATRQSFRQAARDLHVAQPSLSQQIRALEREYGVVLFDRSTRPITLTEAGATLLVHARRILADVSLLTGELRRVGSPPEATLSLGAMQYLAYLELPALIASFREQHLTTELRVRVGNSGELFQMLLDREVDIAICHLDEHGVPDGLTTHPLRTERLVLVTALDDPLGALDIVPLGRLEHTPFVTFRAGASIRSALEDAAGRAGFVPHVAIESADLATGIELVARGLGVAVVPRRFALHEAGRTAHAELGPVPLTRTVALAWPSDAALAPSLTQFIDHATRTISN
jgi:DNA-binding transcriptional LysR family regulator